MLNKRQELRWSRLRDILKSRGLNQTEVQTVLLLCESETQTAIAEAIDSGKIASEDYYRNAFDLSTEAGRLVISLENSEKSENLDKKVLN